MHRSSLSVQLYYLFHANNGSMISQTGCQRQRGRQPIIWPNFAKNCMKMKSIGQEARVQNFTKLIHHCMQFSGNTGQNNKFALSPLGLEIPGKSWISHWIIYESAAKPWSNTRSEGWRQTNSYYYPQTKWGQGNVFTPICQSFCLRGAEHSP